MLIELTGMTLGIVGFGSIGRALAKRAAAFDMRILAVDLFPGDKPDYVELLAGMEQMDAVLRESDFLVVTVPWTPEADGMIGAAQLALMKPSSMVVGISRGGIIDQKALAQALKEKRIAMAALDVFEPEPLPADSELWDIDNLLVCSHIAGGTQYEGQYISAIFEENLGRFLKGQFPLRNQIDKQRGF
jgi:phosphoglycerate dehydrogenase-like enzyme